MPPAPGRWRNRHKTMNAGKYDFVLPSTDAQGPRHRLDEADRNGAKLPVTALVDQFYKDVQAMGGKRWDTSSLLAPWKNRRMAELSPQSSADEIVAHLRRSARRTIAA